jgi:hypothetical protein
MNTPTLATTAINTIQRSNTAKKYSKAWIKSGKYVFSLFIRAIVSKKAVLNDE